MAFLTLNVIQLSQQFRPDARAIVSDGEEQHSLVLLDGEADCPGVSIKAMKDRVLDEWLENDFQYSR